MRDQRFWEVIILKAHRRDDVPTAGNGYYKQHSSLFRTVKLYTFALFRRPSCQKQNHHYFLRRI